MTLCIGAICQHEAEQRIILCSDLQQEVGDYVGGEVSEKFRWLDERQQWASLIADRGGAGSSLIDTLRSHFKSRHEFPEDEIMRFLEDGMFFHRQRMIDQFFRDTSAITYDEILSNGIPDSKRRFPEKFIEEKLEAAGSLALDAQLLVAGFSTENEPCLFVVNEDPANKHPMLVRRDYSFVAIGTGSPVANVMLYKRRHIGASASLMQALYHVYEAITVSGEVAPGVGRDHVPIDILSPNSPPQSLSVEGYKHLAEQYAKFGPKTIPDNAVFNLDANYFEDFTGEKRLPPPVPKKKTEAAKRS
jgi:hypothetical protein